MNVREYEEIPEEECNENTITIDLMNKKEIMSFRRILGAARHSRILSAADEDFLEKFFKSKLYHQ
jgi:hypothetical protein